LKGVPYAEIRASVVNVSFYDFTLVLEATKLKFRQGIREIAAFFLNDITLNASAYRYFGVKYQIYRENIF
jgi:hypothetical protein